MSILQIYTVNETTWDCKDISLRQPCRKVLLSEINSDLFKTLVASMFETLFSTPSGVGLSAPQIGIQLQLIVVDIKRDGKKPIVLVNPTYKPINNEMTESIESCLSVPQKKGIVYRYKSIEVNYTNMQGEKITENCDGFKAKVLQHEIDHLNGFLYIDRIESQENIMFNEGVPHKIAQNAMNNLNKGCMKIE